MAPKGSPKITPFLKTRVVSFFFSLTSLLRLGKEMLRRGGGVTLRSFEERERRRKQNTDLFEKQNTTGRRSRRRTWASWFRPPPERRVSPPTYSPFYLLQRLGKKRRTPRTTTPPRSDSGSRWPSKQARAAQLYTLLERSVCVSRRLCERRTPKTGNYPQNFSPTAYHFFW